MDPKTQEELNAELESYKPQAQEKGAEAQKLAAGAEVALPPIEVPQGAEAPPAPVAPLPDVSTGADPASRKGDLGADPVAPVGTPGSWGEVVSGGLQRGVAQLTSAPLDLAGIAAEAAGDEAAAQEAFIKARQIESYAPKGYYNLEDVHDAESFAGFLIEGLAENAPNLIASMTGGGFGVVAARMLAKRAITNPRLAAKLMAPTVGATAGAGAVGIGLETAGAGSEFKQRTGSYEPERAAAVGVANGLLEAFASAHFLTKWGGGILKGGAKGALLEGGTELTQELNTAANAAWIDENYDFLSRETGFRLAEAGILGSALGGVTGAVGGALEPQVKPQAKPEEEKEPDFTDRAGWETSLTLLRNRVVTRQAMSEDSFLETAEPQRADVLEVGLLTAEVKREQQFSRMDAEFQAALDDFYDANLPRYVYQSPVDNKWSGEVYTDTDLETELIRYPQSARPAFKEVDQRSLSVGGITATVFDLPEVGSDPRVFFAPWVKPEVKEELRQAFNALGAKAKAAQEVRLRKRIAEIDQVKADLMGQYGELLNKGLRVVPSRGASFIYKGEGQLKTLANEQQPGTSGRSPAVALLFTNFTTATRTLSTFEVPTAGYTGSRNVPELMGYRPVTIDDNKATFEDGLGLAYSLNEFALESNPDAYLYKDKLSFEQKQQKIFQASRLAKGEMLKYPQAYVPFPSADATRQEQEATKAFADKLYKELGMTLRPKAAYRYLLMKPSSKLLPKIVPAAHTPTFPYTQPWKRLPRRWDSRSELIVEADATFEAERNPRAAEVIAAVRELYPTMLELIQKFDMPPVTVRVQRTREGGSVMNNVTGELFISFDHLAFDNEDARQIYPGGGSVKANVALTMLHELGHYITLQKWHDLPHDLQTGIIAAYERARLRFAVEGDVSGTHISTTAEPNFFQPGYSLTWPEYLAEQFRRYATIKEFGNTAGPFYRSVASIFSKLSNGWVEKFGRDVGLNLTYPAWEFHDAMEYLREIGETSAAIKQQMVQEPGRISKAAFALPETVEAVESEVAYKLTIEQVKAWRAALPSNVNVEVSPEVGPGRREGEFTNDPLTGGGTIRLWVGSLQNRGSQNVVAHEATHAIWHLLTPSERAILVAAGKGNKVISKDGERKYFNGYKKQLLDMGINQQEAVRLARLFVEEEYGAWLVGKRANGADFGPPANTILDSLIELFRKVKNLLLGRGFLTPDDIIRSMLKGEVAARAAGKGYGKTPVRRSADFGRNIFWDEPLRVVQVQPGVAAIKQELYEGDVINYFFYDSQGGFDGTPQGLDQAGKPMMELQLSKRGTLGYEVDMVELEEAYRFATTKIPYSDMFYKWVEKDLNQEMRPSGMLLPDGFKMWQRRNPGSVRYHVYDEVAKAYYSPRKINQMVQLYDKLLKQDIQAKASKEQISLNRGMYNKWKKLAEQVDPAYYKDAERLKMFAIGEPTPWEIYVGLERKAADVRESQIEKAVTGETSGPTVDPYMAEHAQKRKASQAANERLLKLPPGMGAPRQPETAILHAIFDRYGTKNPTLGPMLSGQTLGAEADRISAFSKLFISIKQMAWNNPHIQQLRDYVSAKDEMNAMRMKWIERAEERVREWDKLADPKQKDKLADLLFWATEMQYLPPKAAARQPTMQELATEAQRIGLQKEGFDLYFKVQQDFMDYLTEVEGVLAASINRLHTQANPNGTIGLSQIGQQAMAALIKDMAALRKKPYFPMVRFGEYTVTVRDPAQNDAVVWFSAYPTLAERDAAAIKVGRMHPGMRLQVGKMPQEEQEFQGLPPALLRHLKANIPNLSQAQKDAIDKFMVQMAPDKSFKKRWLKRTGTSGYSLDGMRVYAHYFQGGSNYLARMAYKPVLEDAINSLRSTFKLLKDARKRVEIADFMQKDLNYSMEPSRDFHKFRSAVTLWQLGFSPAAAFTNLTQTPVFTLPYFAGVYGARANVLLSEIVKSTKRAFFYNPKQADPQFAAARQLLVQMGKLETGAAPELGAYAEGGNLLSSIAGTAAQRKWRSFMRTSMLMFQQAEKLNREIVLGMGWELSSDPQHPHLLEIESQYFNEISKLANTTVDVAGQPVKVQWDTAVRLVSIREAISRTQFEYSRDYRPAFLRGPLASSFLVFFAYTQSALYAFGNNPGALQLFLTFAFLFGAMGLPGAEDLEEVLNMLARKFFGKDFSLEEKARELVRELTEGTVFDEVGPDLFLHGISRYSFGLGLFQESLGTPQFDASTNGSMGRIVPGLAETARALGRGDDWKTVTGQAAREVAGAGYGQIFPMLQFLGSLASGDILSADWKKWEAIMPRAVKAMSKAGRYAVLGEETNAAGVPMMKFDIRDPEDLATIIAQGFGYAPTQLNMKWDEIMMKQDLVTFLNNRKTTLMGQFHETVRTKDLESRREVVQSIKAFNLYLKEMGLGAMGITPDGLKQSIKQRQRRFLLQERGLPMQKSSSPLYQKIEDLFPGIERVD